MISLKDTFKINLYVVLIFVVIWGGYGWYKGYFDPLFEPELTIEQQIEITDEYIRLLEDVNDARRELIELQKLRILNEEGKLHSS